MVSLLDASGSASPNGPSLVESAGREGGVSESSRRRAADWMRVRRRETEGAAIIDARLSVREEHRLRDPRPQQYSIARAPLPLRAWCSASCSTTFVEALARRLSSARPAASWSSPGAQ